MAQAAQKKVQQAAEAAGVPTTSTGNRAYDEVFAASQILRLDSEKPPSKRRAVDITLTQFPDDLEGLELVEVVGEGRRQAAISAICGREGDEEVAFQGEAILVPDWQNQPDRPNSNATAIHLKAADGDRIEHVGYLSSEDGKRYRQAVEALLGHGRLIGCPAMVRAVDPDLAETPNAGVTLRLPSPEFILNLA
jgi:hypothetical protein